MTTTYSQRSDSGGRIVFQIPNFFFNRIPSLPIELVGDNPGYLFGNEKEKRASYLTVIETLGMINEFGTCKFFFFLVIVK